MAPTLAYWDIRGLAQPIRLLLAYTQTEFEDKMFSCGPPPTFDKSCWFDIKFTLGLDFPNLPYYIDGDVKLTQTNAILKHIARKNDLIGKTPDEQAQADMCADQVMDFRNGIVRLSYNQNFENLKDDYLANLPNQLKMFSTYLGTKPWLTGDNITYPDFHFYEMLDQHKQLDPNCLKEFKNLQEYTERFEALPTIEAYMRGPKFMKAPLNNKMAKFGAQ